MVTYDKFTLTDGVKMHTVCWPVEAPKAVVLIVHGVAEHSGRYAHVAAALNAQGYTVYGFDHRTHGQSGGDTRTLIPTLDLAVDDMKQFFDRVRAAHPDHKIFIYGHSMGSMISTLFCLRYQDQVAGFISSGSPLCVDESVPRPAFVVLSTLARVLPAARLLKIAPKTISRDPKEVEKYVSDPYVDSQSARLGMVSAIAQGAISARSKVNTLRLPLLIMHGTGDQITPIAGSHTLYQQAASKDKTLKEFDGMYHEIHNEYGREQVFATVADWLGERV